MPILAIHFKKKIHTKCNVKKREQKMQGSLIRVEASIQFVTRGGLHSTCGTKNIATDFKGKEYKILKNRKQKRKAFTLFFSTYTLIGIYLLKKLGITGNIEMTSRDKSTLRKKVPVSEKSYNNYY